MQAAQYVPPVQGFSSTYDAAQMVQAQYFAPGLYAAEPQAVSYDNGSTPGLLHAMPEHMMVAQMPRPQPSGASVAGNPMWDDFNKRRNAAIRNQGFTTKESAKGPVSSAQPVGLSQDATNAYLQSIGVAPQGTPHAPQYAAAAARPAAYAPLQTLPMMQPPMQQVQYMPNYAPAHHVYEHRPAPIQYEPLQGFQAYEGQLAGYPGQVPLAPPQPWAPQHAQPAPQGYYPQQTAQADPYQHQQYQPPYGGTYTPPQGSPSTHALKPGQELEAEF